MRILACVVVVVILMAVGTALAVAGRARAATDDRVKRLTPAGTLAAAVLSSCVDEETGVRGYLISGRSDFLKPYNDAMTAIPADIARLRRLLPSARYQALISGVDSAHQAWLTHAAGPELAAIRAGRIDSARALESSGAGKSLVDALRTRLAALQSALNADLAAAAARIGTAQAELLVALLVLAALSLLMIAAVALALRQWLLVPIMTLRTAVGKVEAGRYNAPIPAPGPAEVAGLGAGIDLMRSRLVTALDDTERTLQALAQQGGAVVALRDALAPSTLRASGLRMHGRLDPAEGVLAGDWFDAIDISAGRVGVILGDVSGHGPAAGVHALRLKQLLTAALTSGREPGGAIEWVVDQLGDTDELFATAVVAVIDAGSGLVRYANAGHTDALVLHRAGSDVEVERLGPTGPLISHLMGAPGAWRTRTARLGAGDLLVGYTDGLVEARGTDGHEFGSESVAAELGRDPGRDPQALLDELFAAVTLHAPGRPSDDRTAIVLLRDASAVDSGGAVTGARPVDDPDETGDIDPSSPPPVPEAVPAQTWLRRRRRARAEARPAPGPSRAVSASGRRARLR